MKCSIRINSKVLNPTSNRTNFFSFPHQWQNRSNKILLIVRTSKNTQHLRLPGIFKTWFQFSPATTFIVTNENSSSLHQYLPSIDYKENIIESHCPAIYSVGNLCCQTEREFSLFYSQEKHYEWLCRFDDDQYVNVPLLIEYLKQYKPDQQTLYIGKPSWKKPKERRNLRFWFATYGGGVCYSRKLLRLIRNVVEPKMKFVNSCVTINDPDDIHIAYLLHTKFNINLTVCDRFHHHIESNLFTDKLNASTIDEAITLGFKGPNVPQIFPLFDEDRFNIRTLHCLLYPEKDCLRRLRTFLNRIYIHQKSHRRPP